MNQLKLREGEYILYECFGNFEHRIPKIKVSSQLFSADPLRDSVQFSMHSGKISITNIRVIAQGVIKVTGPDRHLISSSYDGDTIRIDFYEIPIKPIDKLSKNPSGIAFEVKKTKYPSFVNIYPHETSQITLEEHKDNLLTLLSQLREDHKNKRKDERRRERKELIGGIKKIIISFTLISFVTGIIGFFVGLTFDLASAGWGFLIGLVAPFILLLLIYYIYEEIIS